jgi:hypothetical protein
LATLLQELAKRERRGESETKCCTTGLARLANISILFINPSKQACSAIYMVWTASTKFGLHAGNMILIAQIED